MRLFALGGLLTALLLLLAAISISGFQSIRSSYNTAQHPEAARAQEMSAYEGWLTADDQTNMYVALAELNQPSQQALMRATWAQVIQGRAQAAAGIAALQTAKLPHNDAALVRQLAADTPIYNGYSTRMYNLVQSVLAGAAGTGVKAAIDNANADVTSRNANISNAIQGVYNSLHAALTRQEQGAKAKIPATVSSTLTLAEGMSALALLIALISTIAIIRSITGPLGRVAAAAKRFARGAVDIDLDVHERSEVGVVADSFRGAIEAQSRLADAMSELSSGHLGFPIDARSDEDVLSHSVLKLQAGMRESMGEHSSMLAIQRGLRGLLETLRQLQSGLTAMNAGDLTVEVDAHLKPIVAEIDGEPLGFVADSYNEMIVTAQASLDGYNEVRETLREKLGDQSCLEALSERLQLLSGSDLNDLQDALRAMNDGDLRLRVDPTATPIPAPAGQNVGQLAHVFNEMLANTDSSIDSYNAMRDRISEMLEEIARNAHSVSATSVEMATSSEETGRAIAEIAEAVGTVAQGAEEQVRSVSGARRSSEELADASDRSAEIAAETSSAAEQARALAREGVSAAENASEAMLELRDSSESTTNAIRSLGAKSDQIGGIVATITALAAQTNLLALNAAIEAARAGDHGRGFAVVAEEVRQLAEESQTAAGTIAQLIEEIQRETANAIEIVEHGSERTQAGVATVEQTRDVFLQIGRSVEDVTDRVDEIAAAIRQIAASGGEMRETMSTIAMIAESSSASAQQVSAGTQQTSASTEEVAASAQELAASAAELDRFVDQFVLA